MPKCDFNKAAKQLFEITLRYDCSPVNLLHVFRACFPKSTSGKLLLFTARNLFLSDQLLESQKIFRDL